MDEMTLQRSLRTRPPGDPQYRPRLTDQPGVAADHATTTRPRIVLRTRPMLTAAQLVVMAVIVSLSVGALLFAAGGSPAPTPATPPSRSAEPRASLVTETIAPGLERVIGVGVFRLDGPGDTSMNHTGIGLDGTIWMLETDRLLRLDQPEQWSRDGVGSPDDPEWVPGFRDDIQVAADGTVFTTSWPIRSFDGTAWTLERDGYLFSGQADGTIWAYGDGWIARWQDGRWTEWSVQGVMGGAPYPAAATPDGTVWLGHFDPERAADVGYLWTLARFDGTELTEVMVPGAPDDVSPTLIASGPDGTLWVYLWSRAGAGYLASLTSDGWTVFGPSDGVPVIRDFYQGALGFMVVGPGGRVWLTPQDEPGEDDCGGVASFDGAEWTAFLEDVCVVDLDVAPDGSVWVQTAVFEEGASRHAGATYRITQR